MDQKAIATLLVQGSLILFVASIGMRAQWRDVLGSISSHGLLFRGIVAVNVVVPLVAIGMCSIFPIEHHTRIGIIIMAVSPLAPFVAAKMQKAGLTASHAIGLYVSLMMCSVIIVPGTVALLSALLPVEASVSVAAVAKLVVASVFLPLAAGLMLNQLFPAFAARLAPVAVAVGLAVLMLFVIVMLFKAARGLFALVGDGTLVAIIVTVSAGLVAGHWLGGPEFAERKSLALAAATRHPGIAALIATSNFGDQRVLLAIVLFLVIGVAVSAVYERWAEKAASHPENPQSPS
jgi:BASS family bile acid:Na+ symporter